MEPKLIPISVAGPEVLASVAAGIETSDQKEGLCEECHADQTAQNKGSGAISEKNLKNTQMDLTSPL